MKNTSLLAALVIGYAVGYLSACAQSTASGPHVEVVPAPIPGFTCFAIHDAGGNVVGGNCVPQ